MKYLVCLILALIFPLVHPNVLAYVSNESNSKDDGLGDGVKHTNCSCGWTNKARIVGGKQTLKNEFPLMAGIMEMVDREVFCGATILTHSHAISASHCTVPYKGQPLSLLVGAHDLRHLDDESHLIPIKETIEHKAYDELTYFNDIALLVLAFPMTFTQNIGPACLPTERFNLVNEQIKVLGWGRIKNRGDTSNILLKVNLKVFPITSCASLYVRKIETDKPFQLCTFRLKKDSCQGDSGGPLLWHDDETNRFTLVGIVSYGKTCGSKKSPAVNTEIGYFLDWIQNKIAESGGDLTCSKE